MAVTYQPINPPGTLHNANPQTTSFVDNGFTTDTLGGIIFPFQQGVPMQTLYLFKVIPAALSANCIAPAGSEIVGNGYVTLQTQAQENITKLVIFQQNNNCIQLDCERSLLFTFADAVLMNCQAIISGWDYRGIFMEEQINFAVDATTGTTVKPFSIVKSIYFNNSPGVAFSIGNSNVIGLPYLCIGSQFIMTATWNSAALVPANVLTPGLIWRAQNAVAINSPSARGTITVPSNTNGTIALFVYYFVYGADSETNININNNSKSDFTLYSVQRNENSQQPVTATLTEQDLVGMQYPTDVPLYTAYIKLIKQK